MLGWIMKQGRRTQALRIEVGADIVLVADVAAAVGAFGSRYLSRVFTEQEVHSCARATSALSMPSLAARFAAKEAVMKVLRPTRDTALAWSSIEVIKTASGAPEVCLRGNAAKLAKAAGIERFALSLSHDGQYATATAVAMRLA